MDDKMNEQTIAYLRRIAELLGIADRMARYLGWAFEQNLIRPNETAELLNQVLREWREAAREVKE